MSWRWSVQFNYLPSFILIKNSKFYHIILLPQKIRISNYKHYSFFNFRFYRLLFQSLISDFIIYYFKVWDSLNTTEPEQATRKNQNERDKQLIIGTWNIRRGLVKREYEILALLNSENFDVLLLTETDTKSINAQYKLEST